MIHAAPEIRRPAASGARRRTVLIDALKLADPRMDGVKRYVVELLRALRPIADAEAARWEFRLALPDFRTRDLRDADELLWAAEGDETAAASALRSDPAGAPWKQRLKASLGQALGANGYFRAWQVYRGARMATLLGLHWPADRLPPGARARVQRWLPPITYHAACDLVHQTLPNSWEAYRRIRAPRLLTVHDLSHLACPELQEPRNNHTLANGLSRAVADRADFLCVSQATRDDLLRHYPVDSARTRVTLEACAGRFAPPADAAEAARARQSLGLGARPYLLALGTVEPRKNLALTARAFRELLARRPDLDVELAIVGRFGWQSHEALARELAGEPRIRLLGYVADELLPALYAGAAAFSYVSHYEGFGLPPLEAMSCGVPVVYGRNSSLPEVVGEAGLAVESQSVSEIRDAFERLLADEGLRQRLAAAALARASLFSWKRTAEQTFAAYEACLARQNGRREVPAQAA